MTPRPIPSGELCADQTFRFCFASLPRCEAIKLPALDARFMMQHARVKITCVGCTRLLLTHTCTSAPHYLMVTAVSSYIIPPVVKEIRLFRLLFTLVRLVPVHLVLMVTDVLRRGCAYHCDPDTIVSFIPDEFHYAHYYFLV